MATNKPALPSITFPDNFGTSASNVKTPYTNQELIDGYSHTIQQVYDGGNLNYFLGGVFQNMKYIRTFTDWLRSGTANTVPYINSSNQLDYATPVLGGADNTFTGINTFEQTIVGNISGSSLKATQDGLGNVISTTYMDKNASNATATAKQTIVGWGEPDYASIVQITLPYTVPKNGYILRNIFPRSYIHIKINNSLEISGGATDNSTSVMNPVSKNDVVSISSSNNSWAVYFIPSKGVL